MEMCIVGFWQPVDWTVGQNPLAVLDGRSVEVTQDPVPIRYPTGRGQYGCFLPPLTHPRGLLHNEQHRWGFYKNMSPDEALLFLHYDTRSAFVPGKSAATRSSAPKGGGLFTECAYHTSFHDGTAPADAAPRRSVEARVLCVFEGRGGERPRGRL